MVNAIPNSVRKTWDAWNIRGLILISLGFQIFLILFSPLRKRIRSTILTFSLWSAYLLADYSANFCIGLIFDKRNDISTTSVKDYIVVFWAPFLLLHLGGQDTITAFSLEDNQLWLRHLLSLVFQLVTIIYVFLLTIPGNTLWLPTVLVFFAGIIKYIERTRSLYLASLDTFRVSVMVSNQKGDGGCPGPVPDTTLNVSEHDDKQTEADHVELVRKGYEYFKRFRGLVVDKTYSFTERNDCRMYFRSRKPEDALEMIEVELSFIYEYFFTKASVMRTQVGYVFRFASFSSILAALLIFFFDNKRGFNKFDVKVTYALLLGAVGLEFVAFLMLILSDYWAEIGGNILIKHFLKLKKPKWSNCKKEPCKGAEELYTDPKFKALSTNPLFRRWTGKIPGLYLATNCHHWVNEYRQLFDDVVPDKLVKWRLKRNNPFVRELWVFIFIELKMKSGVAEDREMVRILCKARGGWSIQESELEETEKGKLKRYVNSNEVAFDETLIVWHLATNWCYQHQGVALSDQTDEHAYFSKVLADYMIYLLAMEPAIMCNIAGIGQQKIIEMISCMQKFPKSKDGIAEANVSEKVRIKDAEALTKELDDLPKNKRWKIIAKVWVEMLSYAAINCRPDTLVQQLSNGGQFISFIWLLMLHMGLGSRQFKN